MPGRAGIRWKPGEKEQVAKEIRNFNARRRRAIKKNPNLINTLQTIPEKTTIKNITNRKDLQRLLKDIALSKKKGAFDETKIGNVTVTKWELAKTKSRLKTINAQRAVERRKANVSTTKGTMGTIQQNSLKPKKLSNPENQKEWVKFVESVEKQSNSEYWTKKDEQYRTNYISAFREVFGGQAVGQLMNLLNRINAREIVEGMYFNPILNIEFLYLVDEEEASETLILILEAWEMYIRSIGK